MKIYRVGGAVRDMLLGAQPKDHDYVVVGATVEEFRTRYPSAQAVGKSFPVFLVPKGAPDATDCFDHDWSGEYAFARKERKTGAGHNGFEVVADPSVTLEEDLSRRDLTVNAMALPQVLRFPLEQDLVDPFGGLADLRAGILRHVGPAFVEDPLRVYRLARFAARFGFGVAPETIQVCRDVPRSELEALSGERVGQELLRALRSPYPWSFFEVLKEVGALDPWFAEVAALIGVPAGPPAHHQEGDSFEHTMLAVAATAYRSGLIDGMGEEQVGLVRWGAVCHDLGKALTPKAEWPSHMGHDERGVAPAEALADRLRLPAWFKQAGATAAREHMRVHFILEMRKGTMADLVRAADATRLKAEGLSSVCCADACGKVPVGDTTGARALVVAARAARAEKGHPIPEGLEGEKIGLHVRSAKGAAIRRALRVAGFIQGGPERPQHERVRWGLQPTESFPEGAPQRENYLTDEHHKVDCEAYAKEWRKVFRCTGCDHDRGCPQHGDLGWKCRRPPEGWVCTRDPGHSGPCAAVPDWMKGPMGQERKP